MIPVAVVAAVVVGAVFVVAGAAKLVNREVWVAQVAALRVPSSLAAVVPGVEVVLGALLISQIARGYVASMAALVLVAFTTLILARITQGERPPCACFGGWSATPLGAWHVVRNAALIVMAMTAALA
jgi:uncharacterized membrane protein YphA (DoxX/SURF4 family)